MTHNKMGSEKHFKFFPCIVLQAIKLTKKSKYLCAFVGNLTD